MIKTISEFFTSYSLLTLLLSACFALSRLRFLTANLLQVSNLMLAVNATIYVFLFFFFYISVSMSEDVFEAYAMANRATGPNWLSYWINVFIFGIVPQLMWFKRFRTSIIASLICAMLLLFPYYVMLFPQFNRASLRSVWSIDYASVTIHFLIYSAIVFFIYLLRRKFIKNEVV